jgi:hypothetical protein
MKKEYKPLDEAIDIMSNITTANSASAISLDDPSSRDVFFMDLGVIKGLQFSESTIKYAKAIKLYKLTQNKTYKKLGVPNFGVLCEKIGLKPTTGRALLNQIEAFGQQGYKAMLQTGLKQKEINFLAKVKPDVSQEGDKLTIKVGNETVSTDDKDALERLIQNLEKEKKVLQEQKEKIYTEKEELIKENESLKKQVVIQADPDKNLEIYQRHCSDLLNEFTSIVSKLVKIQEKYPYLVMETTTLMQATFIKLKNIVNADDEAEFKNPEESIQDL